MEGISSVSSMNRNYFHDNSQINNNNALDQKLELNSAEHDQSNKIAENGKAIDERLQQQES